MNIFSNSQRPRKVYVTAVQDEDSGRIIIDRVFTHKADAKHRLEMLTLDGYNTAFWDEAMMYD